MPEDARNAVVMLAELVVPALKFVVPAVVDKTAEKQVQTAIVVVVEPDRAGGPAGFRQTRFFRHIGERPIVVVLIKNAFPIRGDEYVRPAVIVEISDRHAHPERAAGNTRLLRNIRECAVPVVLVKRVADRLLRLPEVAGTAVHQIDIHPAVIVEIEKSAARTHGFGQVMFRRHRIVVYPLDTA